jgi:flagellar FliL protein
MSDAEKPAAVAAPAKKSGKGIIIIALIAILAAGAAGGGVYFMTSHQASDEESASSDDGDDAAAAEKQDAKAKGKKSKGDKGAKGKKSKKEVAKPLYLALDPPFVVNFEAKGVMRFLQITVQVMTRDPHTLDLLKENDPLIKNNLLMMFSSQTYETISTPDGKEKMRAQALEIVGKAIAEEGGEAKAVEQLLFTSFVMQ